MDVIGHSIKLKITIHLNSIGHNCGGTICLWMYILYVYMFWEQLQQLCIHSWWPLLPLLVLPMELGGSQCLIIVMWTPCSQSVDLLTYCNKISNQRLGCH